MDNRNEGNVIFLIILLVSLIVYGLITHNKNKNSDLNQTKVVKIDKNDTYESKRIFPVGVRNPVDKVFNPIEYAIDPYGVLGL